MKQTLVLLFSLFYFVCASAQAQIKPKLLAGPVIGAVTKTTAKIWIGYVGKGDNVLVLGDTSENKLIYPTSMNYISNKKGEVALTMEFTGLKPGRTYNILVSIDGYGTHAKFSFKTEDENPAKDFDFLVGSCNLLQYDVTRAVFPGGANWIYKRMKKKDGEFMVWLGDNVYYLYRKDWSTYEGMFKRQMKTRRVFNKFYRNFLGNQPNYAMWDDHDYGPNNADKNFALKDTSLKIYKAFGPNEYPLRESLNGNYFSFKKYDAEFFMTDCRFHRDPKGDTAGSFLGETQILWLKNKLTTSDATFKFICMGSQVLNDNGFDESYSDFPRERNDLLDFIADNNIKGVVFLTGDKHYSELCKRNWKGYPMYDFTCSPLTAPPLPRKLLGAYKNQWRVAGTDYARRNFGGITISGNKGERIISLKIYGRAGGKRREIILSQKDFQKQ